MVENEEHLLSVVTGQNIENLLTPDETLKIQGKLWDILSKRAESYTAGSSSSIRVETAQELLKSAGFVLRHGITGDDSPEGVRAHLLGDDFDMLFRAGLEAIRLQVTAAEALLETAVRTAPAAQNLAYRDTLRELGAFFKRYHYHHFAHEIPCMIDYPLAQPVDEKLLGIDYVEEYLRRLTIENDFCGRFDTETVTLLLRSISPDYKEDLLNIYEAVAASALALTLLNGDSRALDITDRDRSRLISLVGAWADGDAPAKLRAVAAELCEELDIGDNRSREYLAETAIRVFTHVRPMLPAERLERVFPSLCHEKGERKTAVAYIDGALMDDGKLRALINELMSCRFVPDKIALARQSLFSLRDWAEVLNVCFWDDECDALFDALSDDELKLLRLYSARRRHRFPEWRSETHWETHLAEYKRKPK